MYKSSLPSRIQRRYQNSNNKMYNWQKITQVEMKKKMRRKRKRKRNKEEEEKRKKKKEEKRRRAEEEEEKKKLHVHSSVKYSKFIITYF